MPKNDVDRIVKENLVLNLLDVFKVVFEIEDCELDPEADLNIGKLQDTIEREPDFVRVMKTPSGRRFILHLEFQTTNEKGMLLRMQEYHALLQRKVDLPIKHYVMYLGKRPPKMVSEMDPEKRFDGFQLENVSSYDPEQLLQSDVPEEIILAVLGNFGEREAVSVIQRILSRLQQISDEEVKLQKYIYQLTVLARLRNLQKETIKQTEAMALTIDINKDVLYKKGIEEGKSLGIEKEKENSLKARKNSAKTLKAQGVSAEVIANALGLSIREVHEL